MDQNRVDEIAAKKKLETIAKHLPSKSCRAFGEARLGRRNGLMKLITEVKKLDGTFDAHKYDTVLMNKSMALERFSIEELASDARVSFLDNDDNILLSGAASYCIYCHMRFVLPLEYYTGKAAKFPTLCKQCMLNEIPALVSAIDRSVIKRTLELCDEDTEEIDQRIDKRRRVEASPICLSDDAESNETDTNVE